MTSTVEHYTQVATIWVKSLDRNRLGRFVVDKGDLLLVHSNFSQAIESFSHGFQLSHTDVFIQRYLEPRYVNVIAELWFWWLRTENKEVIRQVENYRKLRFASEFNGVEFPHNINERIAQLSLVVDHPDYHDYFAVNIWNIKVIERCKVDSIDADMASRLVKQ